MAFFNDSRQFKYQTQEALTTSVGPLTLAVSSALALGAAPAVADQRSSTITVNSMASGFDVSACSLRAAIATANTGVQTNLCNVPTGSPVTIEFFGPLTGTISETSEMQVDVPMVINGDNRITVELDSSDPIFSVAAVESFTLENIALTGGSNGAGAGVVSESQHLTIRNSSFTGFDSGFFASTVTHGPIVSDSSLLIEYSEFRDNYSGSNGGAIAAVSSGSVSILNSEFTDNEAKYDGGAVKLTISDSDSVILTGNTFNRNIAGLDDEGGNGGAIDLSVSNSVVSIGGNFLLNEASGSGGAIHASLQGGSLELVGAVMEQNYADYGGGGLAFSADGAELEIRNSEFYYNAGAGRFGTTDALGGGVLISDAPSSIDIIRTPFQGNRAYAGAGLAIDAPSAGSGSRSLSDSEMSGNEIQGGGNGAAIYLNLSPNRSFTVSNSTLSNNHGAAAGGGIFVASEDTALNVKYSTLAYNAAEDEGAGISIGPASSSAVVRNSILQNFSNGQPQDTSGANISIQNSLIRGAANSNFTDAGGNILNQDARLLPLAFNGGLGGQTHRLRPDSPAVDAGDPGSNLPNFDQRGPGFPRIVGDGLDMGAFELEIIDDQIFSDRFE